MYAYFITDDYEGWTKYSCYDHTCNLRSIKGSREEAVNWVINWNKHSLPNPDTLAPLLTCTSNSVPCQKGNNPMSFDDCFCTQSSPSWSNPPVKTKASTQAAGAVASIVVNADTTEADQRRYLASRASDLKWSFYRKLSDQFFISEPDGPQTTAELKDRLAKGLYTITPADEDEDEEGFYWRESFSWRTPDTQVDKAGYKAASKALEETYNDLQDKLRIVSPVDGLAALEEFKAWTFVKPTA